MATPLFSKHCFFSGFLYSFGLGSCILLIISFFLSCVYSVRFVFLLFSGCGGLTNGYSSSFLLISTVSFLGTILNYYGGVVLTEVYDLGVSWNTFLLLVQFFGFVTGWLLYYYSSYWVVVWESLVWGGDSLVRGIYGVFLSLSSVSLLSIYRWEVYLLGLFPVASFDHRFSVFSMNFMALALVFCLAVYFLFFG